MADEMNVSVITVKHAYELLCDEGYPESRERSGCYVIFRKEDGFAKSVNMALPQCRQNYERTISSFPFSVLSKTMRRIMNDYGESLLEKTPHKGSVEFRDTIRKYLARNRNIHVDAEQILVE